MSIRWSRKQREQRRLSIAQCREQIAEDTAVTQDWVTQREIEVARMKKARQRLENQD